MDKNNLNVFVMYFFLNLAIEFTRPLAQWVRASAPQAEGLVFDSSRDRPVVKQVVTAPLLHARH